MINENDLIRSAEIRISCRPSIFVQLRTELQITGGDDKSKLLYSRTFVNSLSGLRVLFSIERHGNGLHWVHVSASVKDRYPTWDELKMIKEVFLGDVWAYQILPPKEHYINISKNCFHLWHCVNRDIFDEGADYPLFGAIDEKQKI